MLQALTAPKYNFAMSNKFWISLGVVIWLYYAVSHIPANWGAYFATRSGDLAMSGVSGTIWSGRASLASFKYKQVDHSLGELSWKFDILSFFTLKPCALVNTQMDNQQFDGRVCIGRKGAFKITNATANLPAALLQQLLPIAIDGHFSLNIQEWDMEANQLNKLHAKASWEGARIYNGTNWMSVGTLGADLVDDGKKGLSGHVFDVQSPVHMDMVLAVPFPSGMSVKGGLSMPEAFFKEANAAAWLAMFAIQQPVDEQGNVRYTMDLNL